MIEFFAQVRPDHSYHPMPMELDKVKAHKPNQIVRLKAYGTEKARSVPQLNTYFACCAETARNTENKRWNTKEKVDFQCRVNLHFVDPDLVVVKPNGDIQFSYRSISFKNLGHIDACGYFDRALEVMADFLDTTVEKLIEMAQSHMGEK